MRIEFLYGAEQNISLLMLTFSEGCKVQNRRRDPGINEDLRRPVSTYSFTTIHFGI